MHFMDYWNGLFSRISVMENQEIDVIMFFYERGKSKADRERGALFCESILKTSVNGVNQCKG